MNAGGPSVYLGNAQMLEQSLVLLVVFALGIWFEKSGWNLRIQSIVARVTGIEQRNQGICKLVGAGPGDIALLTTAARNAIIEADIVIADRLIRQEVLDLVKGELLMSRKYKGCANKAQEELHQWTLRELAKGKSVVRLKGGDPFLYGRGAEEIQVFRKAGFPVQVIPGISSALSAPLSAGIAPTTRGVADQLLVATGHGKNDTIPRDVPQYYAGRTTVYLMSVSRMEKLMERLQSPHVGYPGATPVAVVEKATTSEQRVIRGQVSTISKICQSENVESPATIIVGRASEALLDNSFGESESVSRYLAGRGCVEFFPLPQVAV